jgi:hypothetical protein
LPRSLPSRSTAPGHIPNRIGNERGRLHCGRQGKILGPARPQTGDPRIFPDVGAVAVPTRLEAVLPAEQIKLKFVGSIWARVDAGVDRDVPATSVWGLTFQVLEQLGFRKIVDTSFMIGFMFPNNVDEVDVERYMNGMKRAQMDLDIEPERYKHYYLNEIPDRYKSKVDVRRFSGGERIVFLPYTESTYAKTQAWLHDRHLFDEKPPALDYAANVAA